MVVKHTRLPQKSCHKIALIGHAMVDQKLPSYIEPRKFCARRAYPKENRVRDAALTHAEADLAIILATTTTTYGRVMLLLPSLSLAWRRTIKQHGSNLPTPRPHTTTVLRG